MIDRPGCGYDFRRDFRPGCDYGSVRHVSGFVWGDLGGRRMKMNPCRFRILMNARSGVNR